MTERLPVVSGRRAVAALGRLGFVQVSQRGSHVKLRNESGRTVILPLHEELARGTLRSVLRQAGVSPREFADLL